jgi:hypothetical protein
MWMRMGRGYKAFLPAYKQKSPAREVVVASCMVLGFGDRPRTLGSGT